MFLKVCSQELSSTPQNIWLCVEHREACFTMLVCYSSPENPMGCAHRTSRVAERVICLKELA